MATETNSVGRAQHSEPNFTLYGRIAAGGAGKVSWPDPPDLHFSLVITDAYSGITVIDGQPTMLEAGLRNLGLIKTNSYINALPSNVVVRIPLQPPEGMSRQEFARRLIERSRNFSSYVAPYSLPRNQGIADASGRVQQQLVSRGAPEERHGPRAPALDSSISGSRLGNADARALFQG
jgi:hypothetical protein